MRKLHSKDPYLYPTKMDELKELNIVIPRSFKHDQVPHGHLIESIKRGIGSGHEEWHNNLLQLWTLDQVACKECISFFCTTYSLHHSPLFRQACEFVLREPAFDFLTRYTAAEALQNYFYVFEILEEASAEILAAHTTIIIDNLAVMLEIAEFTSDRLWPLLTFALRCEWRLKYSLVKRISEVKGRASIAKQSCMLAINSSPLHHYTVLAMQLVDLTDDEALQLFERASVCKEENVKADVMDHLLSHPATQSLARSSLGGDAHHLDNPQNVHAVIAGVEEFVRSHPYSLQQHKDSAITFKLRHPELVERIEMDNGRYAGLTLAELFAVVCTLVKGNPELEKRLVEELQDMHDTCSSGHVVRLLNVFTGFAEFEGVALDPKLELRGVMTAKCSAYILGLPKDIGDALTVAWSEQDDTVLQTYLYKQLALIHDELFADYVQQNLIKEADFTETYRDILNKLFNV